jgi:iron complex transport system substrate-binding protein
VTDFLTLRVSRRTALILGLAASTSLSAAAIATGVKDAAGFDSQVKDPKRIITIGAAATEIVFALGLKDKVVAVDTTSKDVPGTRNLPDIGYMRALAAEGILAQTPDLIIATLDSGPKEVIATLRQSKVPVVQVPVESTIDGILKKIDMLGTLLDKQEEAKALILKTQAQADALKQMVANLKSRPKALFVLSFAGGKITVGGTGSSAGAILDLVGAENIASGLHGYQPISPEVLAQNPPDAIIVMTMGPTADALDKAKDDPILSTTPAAKAGHVFAVDGVALLGFGTRSLEVAGELAKQLHG